MRFATAVAFSPADHYAALARASEEAGIWGMSVSDHLAQPRQIDSPYPYTTDGKPRFEQFTPWLDPMVSIGAMSSVTERLHFFTNVYVLGLRNVLVTAKSVSTASILSNGRVALGIGLGWMAEEFALAERPFANRGARIDEQIEILRGLWASGGEWYSYSGRFHELPEFEMTPAPDAPIPIFVGGTSDFALKRAARLGDGWISDLQTRDSLAESIARINELREEYGTADRPFSFVCSSADAVRVEDFAVLEELGVDVLLTMPWVFSHGFTEDLQARIDGTFAFAENVMKPLAHR